MPKVYIKRSCSALYPPRFSSGGPIRVLKQRKMNILNKVMHANSILGPILCTTCCFIMMRVRHANSGLWPILCRTRGSQMRVLHGNCVLWPFLCTTLVNACADGTTLRPSLLWVVHRRRGRAPDEFFRRPEPCPEAWNRTALSKNEATDYRRKDVAANCLTVSDILKVSDAKACRKFT